MKKIWITGHKGMLGSAMIRALKNINAELLTTSRSQVDLYNQYEVLNWMKTQKPDYVFHIGAKVGGIMANKKLPADFILDNLMIQTNVIHGAHLSNVKKLVFVASNCIYPSITNQPIPESAILTGPLDENIRSYAISKIAGIELCLAYKKQYGCEYKIVIPPNLYGPGDNYHPQNNHVIAGLIQRAHEANQFDEKKFVVWGDGTSRREILHVDDLAEAMKIVMFSDASYDIFNVGVGYDYSISELANMIIETVGFSGEITFDTSKPNGTKQKLLDSSRIFNLGWRPKINPKEGLKSAYNDFLNRLTQSTLITG